RPRWASPSPGPAARRWAMGRSVTTAPRTRASGTMTNAGDKATANITVAGNSATYDGQAHTATGMAYAVDAGDPWTWARKIQTRDWFPRLILLQDRSLRPLHAQIARHLVPTSLDSHTALLT